jgi:uncharacterized protein YukE
MEIVIKPAAFDAAIQQFDSAKINFEQSSASFQDRLSQSENDICWSGAYRDVFEAGVDRIDTFVDAHMEQLALLKNFIKQTQLDFEALDRQIAAGFSGSSEQSGQTP